MESQFREKVLDRFLRYVRIHTTSDRHRNIIPSTDRQWDLIRLLEKELHELGLKDVDVTENGYIIAGIPASPGIRAPAIGFMAHIDTAEDAPGENVKPKIWENYDGGRLDIGNGIVLDPAEFPVLTACRGNTVITSDGSTLLGADDKAGVAEIMTALEYLLNNSDIKHGEIEIIFTPDEETGKGLDLFPVKRLKAVCCYTLDGDESGTIESECFTAYHAALNFKGVMIHPGTARGKMVNAITMASRFLQVLPQAESPEATDGRYGFYYPMEISGNSENVLLEILLRDFDSKIINQRIDAIKAIAEAVEKSTPGGKITVDIKKQYVNMRGFIDKDPRILDFLRQAVKNAGIEPREKIIRGGTDGSRLSEMGIPTPNIFTGGQNFHSVREWASLDVMVNSVKVIIELCRLWAG